MKRETSWDRMEYLKRICAAFNAPAKQEETWDVSEPIMMPFEDGVQKVYPKVWDQTRIDLFEAGETSKLLKTKKVKEIELTIAELPSAKKVKKEKKEKMGSALMKTISHVKSKI